MINLRTGIDLFAGIGGFSLAMQMNNVQVLEQVEIEPYPVRVLEKNFPEVKRHGDIRTYKPVNNPWIVCGGFPCQDISTAGKGAGLSGERSGLWWEMHRVIKIARPDWLLIENVPALRTRGSDEVLLSLEEIGYAAVPLVVGAESIGSPHERKRVWIVGYAYRDYECSVNVERGSALVETIQSCEKLACSSVMGRGALQHGWEVPRLESGLGRAIDGIPGRVDKHRIKALGNSIVPQVAALIIKSIIQTEEAMA